MTFFLEEGKKKGAENTQSYSIKDLENLKKQWEDLPVFVKKYIKQLEGDVTKLKVRDIYEERGYKMNR